MPPHRHNAKPEPVRASLWARLTLSTLGWTVVGLLVWGDAFWRHARMKPLDYLLFAGLIWILLFLGWLVLRGPTP